MDELTRRKLLVGAAAGAALAAGVPPAWRTLRQPRARVATLRALSYDADLSDLLARGIALFPETVRRFKGGRVVLKPNMVEWNAAHPINTDARLIVSAAAAFRRLGAREVVVAEGPGHHRDTELLLELTGLSELLDDVPFVDLNVDRTGDTALPLDVTGLGSLHFPGTVLGADLLVSLPKLKTHHWVGVTLSLKNLFGTVPGAVYGWPKNVLHWAGLDRSIVDLQAALQPGFAIVDGIVGMEGDGPLMGDAKPAGVVIMGEQPTAVDATAARLMGIDPSAVGYLAAMARLGGTVSAGRIEDVGDRVPPDPFALTDRWKHIRA